MKEVMVIVQRHLNKLRWTVLTIIFSMLILLPFLHLYQTYEASHAYDLLTPTEKSISDTMEWISKPFVHDPEVDLNNLKGTTWSGTLFGLKLSDPLAVVGQISAGKTIYLPFLITALIPIFLTIIFGRFFCGWICPATFIYELNDNLATWLRKAGLSTGKRKMDFRLKYLVLVMGIIISAATGMIAFASIYPPALIGREIYYAIALSGFGSGMVFFLLTVLFDLIVTRRGFCRYICPGGALYSLLGYFRLVRIQRDVTQCNDCAKCNVVCQFGLDPLRDNFTMDCNNCTACIAVCPTDALSFKVSIKDIPNQGAGHLGHEYKRSHNQDRREQDQES